MVYYDEIKPGAVVWMDPEILEAHGVSCPRWSWDRIGKVRPYLCVWTDGERAIFVAMSSQAGTYWHPRLFIPPQYRVGSPKFRQTEQHVCGDGNFYDGPLHAFQAASEPDRSWRGHRNGVREDFLPEALDFIGLGRLA